MRPCEAMQIRSHFLFFAVAMICFHTSLLSARTVSSPTPAPSVSLRMPAKSRSPSARDWFRCASSSTSSAGPYVPYGLPENFGYTCSPVIRACVTFASSIASRTAFCDSFEPSVGTRMFLNMFAPWQSAAPDAGRAPILGKSAAAVLDLRQFRATGRRPDPKEPEC